MLNRSSFFTQIVVLASAVSVVPVLAAAQVSSSSPPVPSKRPLVSRYLGTKSLHFEALVSGPPASGSLEDAADRKAVHTAQASRTPAEIKDAQRDDQEESIFAYATVLGPRFVAAALPLTAALSQHLREESSVVNPALKVAFNRPRPFVTDPTVTPVCERTPSNSYPSGHAMVGYLEAFALAQMLPEKAGAIMKRADSYAHNRIVCGVHYPTDVEASHVIASVLFGTISTSAAFQREISSAEAELRNRLNIRQ